MVEAVVALVVIGMASVPITLLISQSIDQLSRVADANARASAVESALALIDPINPLETPSGEIDMGEISLLWESEVLVAPNTDIKIGAMLASYNIGFYDVQVDLLKEQSPWFSFSVRKVGYLRREIDGNLLGNSQ